MKSPAFQFYPDDFLGSGKVGTMTAEEVGAYTLLLCLDWNENGFVFDPEELARWCRMTRAQFRKVWKRVSRCFDEKDGRMYNPRLQLEREKQARWREKSAQGGRTSAQARAKGGSTTLPAQTAPIANTPSPSPTPVTTQEPKGADKPRAVRVRPPRPAMPWMGRMRTAWTFGTLLPGDATLLAPVVGAVGEDETVERMENFCASADPEFSTLRTFVSKHATYAS
jgi:uncharacterized protein YdaU (DUF1376 family)